MSNVRKKVIAINSSKRRMNTYNILIDLAEKLKNKNIDLEIIDLFDYKTNSCLGCEVCIRGKDCPLKDDTEIIIKKLKDSDGIILSSPVYMSNVSGKLKTFLDRTCKWFHRPELIGKSAMVVSTTAASDLKTTLKYLEKASTHWGLHVVSKIGRTVSNQNEEREEKEFMKFVSHMFMTNTQYKPSLKQLIYFQVQKVLALKVLEVDRLYWEERNWDSKIFFYDSKISLINRFISKAFYNMLYLKINKAEEINKQH